MIQQHLLCALTALLTPLSMAQVVAADPAAQRGYQFLIETALIPADFTESTFDDVWTVWPEPLRSRAANSSPAERRAMAFDRYGLTIREGNDSGKPLQYVVTPEGGWSMNCFACHGGMVYGTPMAGAPNNRFALQSLTEETFQTKLRQGKPPSRMDLGAIAIPLGTTNGTTNAVVFGMGLMSARDSQLNLIFTPPKFFVNHDMDVPPWWYFYKRPTMYIDGFAEKGHRGLMQFTLVPENGPNFYRKHEDDFRNVLAYITSIRPPKYFGHINQTLASSNDRVFDRSYFNTREFGKSADGHRFPDALSESEKQEVLEYLKTL